MIRKILANIACAATLAGTLAVVSSPAQALPAGVLPLASAEQPEVTLVSGGCGPYGHRTPWGACRPNIVGPVYGYGRPYGWHPGWHRWHHW